MPIDYSRFVTPNLLTILPGQQQLNLEQDTLPPPSGGKYTNPTASYGGAEGPYGFGNTVTGGTTPGGGFVNPAVAGATSMKWGDLLKTVLGVGAISLPTFGVTNSLVQQNTYKPNEPVLTPAGMSATQTAGYSQVDTRPETEIGGQDLVTAGETAEQRYLAQILDDIETRRRQTSTGYADLYRQAQMQSARRGGLSDVTGFTGGMQQQYRTKVSAAEQANLLGIGSARNEALAQIDSERLAAESNAKLLAQQEFEFLATQQNQYVNLSNNFYERALEATDETEKASLMAQSNQYSALADQITNDMNALFGLPAMQSVQDGGPQTPSVQTIEVPNINFETEVLGTIGVTDQAKTGMATLAENLSNAATSGTDNYFGYNSEDLFYQSEIFNKLPGKITTNPRSQNIPLNFLFDSNLVTALRGYERTTQSTVIERSSVDGTPVISKANAKKVLQYYYNIHGAISAVK